MNRVRVFIAALSMALLAGCFSGKTDEVIVFAGDSLMHGALVSVQTMMIDGRPDAPFMVANSMGGSALCTTTGYIIDRIDSAANVFGSSVSTVVLHYGANDLAYGCAGGMSSSIDKIAARLSARIPSAKIIWVLPHRHIPGIAPVRLIIERAANRWHNIETLDFKPMPRHLQEDKIHLTNSAPPIRCEVSGNNLLAQTIGTRLFGDDYTCEG